MNEELVFELLISLKLRIEDDIALEKNGIRSGYKIKALRDELKKVNQCLKS